MRSKNKDGLCQEAEGCLQIGNYQAAIDIYRRLVADYPGEESILLALAWSYYDAGFRDEAICCFEQLFSLELSRSVFTGFAYDELVRLFKTSRQYNRLVTVCAQAVQARPDDTALLSELSAAYLLAGRTRDAKAVCRRAIALEPAEPSLYCLLGDTHLAAREFTAAETAYRRAAKLDGDAASSFWSRLASHYDRIGEHQREATILRKCLHFFPRDPLYHCRMGDCLINQGDLTGAAAAYKKAISLSPASATAFHHRWTLSLANADYPEEAMRVRRCFKSAPFSAVFPS